MRKIKYVAFAVLALLLAFLFYKQNTNELYAEIIDEPVLEMTRMDSLILQYDSLLQAKIDTLGTVGSAVAVTYKGELVYLKCFGVKEWGTTDSVDAGTLFRLASVSKTFTGVLAGKLAHDSRLSLDARIVDYLPGFRLMDSVNTYGLTIRHILSHTSGLVPHAYDNLVEAKVPMRTIIDSLRRVNISAAPGVLYGYQNVVFSLYDTVVQRATGEQFEDLMKEEVFEPFGMLRASVGDEPFRNDNNYAKPHMGNMGKYYVQRMNDRYYNTNPAAGVNASISDMAQYLRALTSGDSSVNEVYMLGEVMGQQVRSPLRWNYFRRWDKLDSKYYGLGWRVIQYKGMDLAYHGGYVRGYRAELALSRDEELGIVYLSNSPNGVGSYSVPIFLDLYADWYSTVD